MNLQLVARDEEGLVALLEVRAPSVQFLSDAGFMDHFEEAFAAHLGNTDVPLVELIEEDEATEYDSWKALELAPVHQAVVFRETSHYIASRKSEGIEHGVPGFWQVQFVTKV